MRFPLSIITLLTIAYVGGKYVGRQIGRQFWENYLRERTGDDPPIPVVHRDGAGADGEGGAR